jgi:hypothetical protein
MMMRCLISYHEENFSPFTGCSSKPGPLAEKTRNPKVNIKKRVIMGILTGEVMALGNMVWIIVESAWITR